MLNALAQQGLTQEEQYRVAVKHDLKVTYKTVIWFNRQTLKAINSGATCLELGAY